LQGQSAEVKQAAGLMLKNNLKSSYQLMPVGYQQYIKAELMPCLGASDRQVRATVAIVISAVVQQGNGQDWPEIFQAFVQCLDSNDYNHMEGALDSLFKVHISSQIMYCCRGFPTVQFPPSKYCWTAG
jgi:transportin-1